MTPATDPPALALQIIGLTVRFGGVVALDGVEFEVREREICGLIGPNGAGKTSLFNCLSGIYAPQAGRILFGGRDLIQTPRHEIGPLGIGRTFQNLALFPNLSVRDNILVGAHTRIEGGWIAGLLQSRRSSLSETRMKAEADILLRRFDIMDIAERPVAGLPFALQKRVEMARALALKPKLLLLDEPAGGLNHTEVGELANQIVSLRDDLGVTILLVEHHLNLVMRISDRVVVLDFGRKIAAGEPEFVQNHPAVIEAYLGRRSTHGQPA